MVTYWKTAAHSLNHMLFLFYVFLKCWLFPIWFKGRDLSSDCACSWSLITFPFKFTSGVVQDNLSQANLKTDLRSLVARLFYCQIDKWPDKSFAVLAFIFIKNGGRIFIEYIFTSKNHKVHGT